MRGTGTFKLRFVQATMPRSEKLRVFHDTAHAHGEIRTHFLSPKEKWYQLLRPPMDNKRQFDRAFPRGPERDQLRYERYVGAIEHAIQAAQRHRFWQGWCLGSIDIRSERRRRPQRSLDVTSATWVSLDGVRVEAISKVVETAVRHKPTLARATEKRIGAQYYCYLCFLEGHESVRRRRLRPSMWEDADHRGLAYYEEADPEASSGMFERPWTSFRDWLTMRRKEP